MYNKVVVKGQKLEKAPKPVALNKSNILLHKSPQIRAFSSCFDTLIIFFDFLLINQVKGLELHYTYRLVCKLRGGGSSCIVFGLERERFSPALQQLRLYIFCIQNCLFLSLSGHFIYYLLCFTLFFDILRITRFL